MTTIYKTVLFALLTLCTSCIAQEKSGTGTPSKTTGANPQIIRNFKTEATAPDYDTMLVSQYIRSIFEDSKGNLWFGTLGEGVVRYDVNTLTYFSNPDGFINNTVYAINEDRNGHIWFGTDQGVYKYDGLTFRNYNQKDGLSHIDITRKGILVDKSGTVWVGTHAGVYRYDASADIPGGQSFSLFPMLPPVNVTGLLEDKSGAIWIATAEHGVFHYDGINVTNVSAKKGLGDNYAGGIAEDNDGNIWFTMKDGICKYDRSTPLTASEKAFTEYFAKDGLGGTEIWGIYIERSGIIWITARGSTTRFDPSIPTTDPKAFTVYTPDDGLNCCVQSMYQDRSGNMWWGAGGGLYRFDGTRFYQVKKNGPW